MTALVIEVVFSYIEIVAFIPHYSINFFTSLQLVLGSDKISTIDEPVVDVALDIREGGASRGVYKQTQVTLGMNAEKLDDFISNLDNINKVSGMNFILWQIRCEVIF